MQLDYTEAIAILLIFVFLKRFVTTYLAIFCHVFSSQLPVTKTIEKQNNFRIKEVLPECTEDSLLHVAVVVDSFSFVSA